MKLASTGASIVVADIDDEHVERVANEVKEADGRAIAGHSDVSRAGDVETMVKAAITAFGTVDTIQYPKSPDMRCATLPCRGAKQEYCTAPGIAVDCPEVTQ